MNSPSETDDNGIPLTRTVCTETLDSWVILYLDADAADSAGRFSAAEYINKQKGFKKKDDV